MSAARKSEFREYYATIPDSEIIRFLSEEYDNLTEEAREALFQEARNRGIVKRDSTLESAEEKTLARCFHIGAYRLGGHIDDYPGLKELSEHEYGELPRTFRGEHIFHGEAVGFAGCAWDVLVASVNGRIYKLAPSVLIPNADSANKAADSVLTWCIYKLGKPSESRTGRYVWDARDGNVILMTDALEAGFFIQLFATDREVRSFLSTDGNWES